MMEYPWRTKRRINAAPDHFRKLFGTRVQKVAIDAGFTCPNRDGTISSGGCTYCSNDAFNPSYCVPEKSITQQIEEGIEFHERRYRSAEKYLAYFQAFSNTYAPLSKLKELYSTALDHSRISGLIIGTRPDCVDEEKLAYLATLAQNYYVTIEYGIETTNDKILQAINRGHTFEQAIDALQMTAHYGLNAGAHFIFGLPGETRQEMLESVEVISTLPVQTVKFHQLQIIRNTSYEKVYLDDPTRFDLFTMEEYIDFMAAFLPRLNPGIVVERLAGETQPRNMVSPNWGPRYDQIVQKIEKRLEDDNNWQGKFYLRKSPNVNTLFTEST